MAGLRLQCVRSPRFTDRRAARGFFALDVIMVTGLTVVLVMLFAVIVKQYAAAQRDSDVRQSVLRAAENELARVEAGLSPLPVPGTPRERTEGTIKLEITATPGEQTWAGMTLVRVTARRQVQGYWVQAELAAYMPVESRHED